MIPDLAYINKSLYEFNQVRFRPTYLSDLEVISQYTRRPSLS